MSNPLDKLEEGKSSANTGDFADWWDPAEGDKLVGVVVEKHDYNGPGGNGEPIPTVLAVEDCSARKGEVRSVKGYQSQLADLSESSTVGDLVLIEFEGATKTDKGYMMNDYQISHIDQADWQSMESAETITKVWEESDYFSAADTGSDSSSIAGEMKSVSADGGQTNADDGGDDGHSGTINDEVRETVGDVVDKVNGGNAPLTEVDSHLNDVRGYDVNPIAASKMAGFEVVSESGEKRVVAE